MKVTIEIDTTENPEQANILINALEFHGNMFEFGERFRKTMKYIDPDTPDVKAFLELYQVWFDLTEGHL
jgi:hypothetical protein